MAYYTVGYPPFTKVRGAPVFTTKAKATEAARDYNKYGEYRGRGCKAYKCDEHGNIVR